MPYMNAQSQKSNCQRHQKQTTRWEKGGGGGGGRDADKTVSLARNIAFPFDAAQKHKHMLSPHYGNLPHRRKVAEKHTYQ